MTGGRALVVADERDIRDAIGDLREDEGFSVVKAEDGRAQGIIARQLSLRTAIVSRAGTRASIEPVPVPSTDL